MNGRPLSNFLPAGLYFTQHRLPLVRSPSPTVPFADNHLCQFPVREIFLSLGVHALWAYYRPPSILSEQLAPSFLGLRFSGSSPLAFRPRLLDSHPLFALSALHPPFFADEQLSGLSHYLSASLVGSKLKKSYKLIHFSGMHFKTLKTSTLNAIYKGF